MKIRAVTAAIAVVGLLAACGGGDPGADGPVTLRMTTWSANEAHAKLFSEIAASLEEAALGRAAPQRSGDL